MLSAELERFKLLQEQSANPIATYFNSSENPFHLAAQLGDLEVVKLFLQCAKELQQAEEINPLSVKQEPLIDMKDYYNETLLHRAVTGNHEAAVKLLLENGANPNVVSTYCGAPLHSVAWRGHAGITKLLLQYKADVNIETNQGYTPLHFVAKYESVEILFLLLLYGANISKEDQIKINNNLKLTTCLVELKQIKAKPHLGRLIEAHNNGDTKTISKYINNIENQEALIQEFQDIGEYYSSEEETSSMSDISECLSDMSFKIYEYLYDFSFIFEHLLDFIRDMILNSNNFKIEIIQKFLSASNDSFEKALSYMSPVVAKIASYLNIKDSIVAVSAEQLDHFQTSSLLTKLKDINIIAKGHYERV